MYFGMKESKGVVFNKKTASNSLPKSSPSKETTMRWVLGSRASSLIAPPTLQIPIVEQIVGKREIVTHDTDAPDSNFAVNLWNGSGGRVRAS
jgi:hypothetical protein